MDVSQLQNLVNYRRRDLTESFISNDEILAYLNEGNRKTTASYEFPWSKVSTSFAYSDGFIRYALSSIAPDLDEPINMFNSPDYYFNQVSPEEFMRLSGYHQDTYAIDGGDLLMMTSFGSGTIDFNYYTTYTAQTSGGSRIANLSATTDEPLMPEIYQDTLVDFAAARCYQKEGMYDDFKIAMNDYNMGVRSIKAKTPSRKKHYPKQMQSPRTVPNTGVADKSDPVNQL